MNNANTPSQFFGFRIVNFISPFERGVKIGGRCRSAGLLQKVQWNAKSPWCRIGKTKVCRRDKFHLQFCF